MSYDVLPVDVEPWDWKEGQFIRSTDWPHVPQGSIVRNIQGEHSILVKCTIMSDTELFVTLLEQGKLVNHLFNLDSFYYKSYRFIK